MKHWYYIKNRKGEYYNKEDNKWYLGKDKVPPYKDYEEIRSIVEKNTSSEYRYYNMGTYDIYEYIVNDFKGE